MKLQGRSRGRPLRFPAALAADLVRDVSHAARSLRRNPGFTIVAALTLALGVGGCAAMYAFTRQLVLLDYPYPDPDSLVVVEETDLKNPGSSRGVGPEAFVEIRDEERFVRDIAGYLTDGFVLAADEGVHILEGVPATGNLFQVMGVEPILGRVFTEEEAAANAKVAVLGGRAWRRYFGGRPDVVGSTVELNRQLYTVIGVMPESFWRGRDVWVPLGRTPAEAGHMRTWARLSNSGAVKDAQAELDVLSQRLIQQDPANQDGWKLSLRDPLEMSGADIGTLLAAGIAPVVLVFLIACVNIAHLQIGRDLQRNREMAVRRAIGASGGRVVRQLLTESLLLALLGGALGAVVAYWGVKGIAAYLPADRIASIGGLELDKGALVFLALLAAGSTVAIGLIPALRAAGFNLTTALKQAGRGYTAKASFRSLLVVTELGLSMMLLVGTAMMILLVRHMTRTDLGFDESNLWSARISLRGNLVSPEARRTWASSTLERIEALPGVVAGSIATEIPLNGGARRRVEASGLSLSDKTTGQAEYRAVTPGYFDTLRVPVRAGRAFNPQDREGAPPVVIVNETLARRYFEGNAVGMRLRTFSEDDPLGSTAASPGEVREIVGVVADVRQEISGDPAPPIAYVPFDQAARAPLSLVVRTQGSPEALGRSILAKLNAPSPEVLVQSVFSFEERIAETRRGRQFLPFSMAVFAGLGLLLAGVGLYGTTVRGVLQRVQEFGIRQALGARKRDVLALVMRESGRGAFLGMALGAAGSLAAARLFLAFLDPRERSAFGVDLLSGPELLLAGLGAAALLVAVILLAAYLPARRAARIEPLSALRYE